MIPEPIIAMRCVYYMHQYGFAPKTLVNVGVGRCPELYVWKWLLPDTELIGIDARGRCDHWDQRYYHFAVNDGAESFVPYCRRCRHCFCKEPGHVRKIAKVQATTIDRIAEAHSGPYFLWLDIDGCEISALKGAKKTLESTPWLNLEVRDFPWDTRYKKRLHHFVCDLGYKLVCAHQGCDDRLYMRVE